ncbi:MAG: TlpA disulfide reductase family protein [Akkermansia sp.]
MKLFHLALTAGLLLGVMAPCTAEAQTTAPATEKPAKKKRKALAKAASEDKRIKKKSGKVGKIGAMLKEIQTVNGTPDYSAKVFCFLRSASWCGPCRKLMPSVIQNYPAMRKKGMEVVLIGFDKTPQGVLQYLQSHKAEFPGMHMSEPKLKENPELSPHKQVGIPYVTIMDADGKILYSGYGFELNNWQKYVK